MEESSVPPEASLEKTVAAYLNNPSADNLEQVMIHAKGLVCSFSKHASQNFTNDEDLIQAGYEGVLKALNNYDPTHNTKFATFASYYIKGELHKELDRRERFKCGGRWMAILKKEVYNAQEKLRRELGYEPSIEELSKEINITEEGVRMVIMSKIIPMENFDLSKIRNRQYENFQLPLEDKIAIQEAIASLPDIQRKVIYYTFYKDLSQTKIGEILGISQRKASRVMYKAFQNIMCKLE